MNNAPETVRLTVAAASSIVATAGTSASTVVAPNVLSLKTLDLGAPVGLALPPMVAGERRVVPVRLGRTIGHDVHLAVQYDPLFFTVEGAGACRHVLDEYSPRGLESVSAYGAGAADGVYHVFVNNNATIVWVALRARWLGADAGVVETEVSVAALADSMTDALQRDAPLRSNAQATAATAAQAARQGSGGAAGTRTY